MCLVKLLDKEIAAGSRRTIVRLSQSGRSRPPELQLGRTVLGRTKAVRLHRLGDQPVDHSDLRLVVAGSRRECVMIDLELVIGAGSASRNRAGMLYFSDAAERIRMGPQDLDQLVDALG